MQPDKPRPKITIKRKPHTVEATTAPTATPAPEPTEPAVQVSSIEAVEHIESVPEKKPISKTVSEHFKAVSVLFGKLPTIIGSKPLEKGCDEFLLKYAQRKLDKDTPHKVVKRFLTRHCQTNKYLKLVSKGGQRYNPVTGAEAAEGISQEESEYAMQRIEEKKAQWNAKLESGTDTAAMMRRT